MYWTYKVDHPMRHETKEDAIAYLSSFITQLPPKMNKFLLELQKQDYNGFLLQTSIQEPDFISGEKVFMQLSSSIVKNDELFESHEIKYNHEYTEQDNVKDVVKDVNKVIDISLMVATEIRELLKDMSDSDDYDFTYNNDRIQVSISASDSEVNQVSLRVADYYYEYVFGLHGSKSNPNPLQILEVFTNKIKSTYINSIEGKVDFEHGKLGEFDLDEFLSQAEHKGKEIVIHVKDKKPVEQDTSEEK